MIVIPHSSRRGGLPCAPGFCPESNIIGRYYGFPFTDKQNIDLNVNLGKFVNVLS